MTEAKDQIWQAIEESNAAWLGGNPQGAAPLFHDDVVMIGPGLQGRIDGKAAVVQSFVDYCEMAKTHSFEVPRKEVDITGDTAVVTYTFAVGYELDGQTLHETGQEVLVFQRGDDGWKAIWRTQLRS